MAVVAVLVVADDDRRACRLDDLDQPPGRLVGIGLPEAVGMAVGIGPDIPESR
jgi:hypothetical protein